MAARRILTFLPFGTKDRILQAEAIMAARRILTFLPMQEIFMLQAEAIMAARRILTFLPTTDQSQ